MPKGKQRTPDEIRAELKARQARIEARLSQLDKVTAAKAKKDQRDENLELGALVRIVIDSDMGVKRKLVEAAGTQTLKDFQRKALERVLGRLPEPVSERVDKYHSDAERAAAQNHVQVVAKANNG